jgi:hypothetical protein
MTNLTISEVNSAIMHQEWTNDQLNSMVMSLKYARERLTKKNIWTLTPGAKVKFLDRRGRIAIGTVTKIKQKKVLVNVNGVGWNVPANMLEAA